ncbi:aldo/keto reductase [Kiritimatiellaeota bacterium B1221]|nr:aldo/keto reductase [Kiritimatiellaeota bacterium B1221]
MSMEKLKIESCIPLRDGTQIPQLGFGVYQLTDEQEAQTAIHTALDAGYRHFDTASAYENEALLGKAFAEAAVSREDLFLTTKCWISEFGKEKTRVSFEESLRKLKTEYVDLYLLHWPVDETMMSAWETLIALQAEGKIKSIGVSNFSVARFEKFFFKHTDVIPAVNQIEAHPLRVQADVQTYCESKTIAVEAYSPLARADVLGHEILKTLAEEIGKSPAQVILRWHLQQGRIVIPKSSKPSRIRENCDLYDFSLTADQMARVDGLEQDHSVIPWRPNDGVGWY